MQQRLKPAAREAWTRIITAQLLCQFLRAVNDAITALHMRFRRVAAFALATRSKSFRDGQIRRSSTLSCPPLVRLTQESGGAVGELPPESEKPRRHILQA